MDTKAISEALGVFPIIQGERETFYLVNRNTNVKVRLELNPITGWLRLHADLRKKSPGRHIAMVKFECVERTEPDSVMGYVSFTDEKTTLTIWASGTFSVDVQ